MPDETPRFPAFSEPASKGDVLTAMIWCQALVGSLFGVVRSIRGGDPKDLEAQLARYNEEWAAFNEKIEEVAGNRRS